MLEAAQRKSPVLLVLLLTVSAASDAAAVFRAAGGPACAAYPPWLPAPWLAEPGSGRTQPKRLHLNVSVEKYYAFKDHYEKISRSLTKSPGSCCGLAPKASSGLVLAEFDILPQLPHAADADSQHSSILASLLPFNNSLLEEQDSLLVTAMHSLFRAGLLGRVSLYNFLRTHEPQLLGWINQSHLFCLAQSRSRLRLVMSRPLNQFEIEANLRGPFRMDFRLAPCDDPLENESQATHFSAEVRVQI